MKTVQGQELVEWIHRLVDRARRGLVLVSPYFDPWEELGDGIDRALARGVRVMIIVREDQDAAEAAARDFERGGAIVSSVSDLHAKVYFSEAEAISTSMNLLTSSANTAVEIGHLFDAAADRQAYGQLIAQSESLVPDLRWADLVAGRLLPRGQRRPVARPRARQRKGYCIRCGEALRFEPERPLCERDFRSWNRFQDVDYREEFCHECGRPAATSMAKPRCYACWLADP